MKWRTSSWKKRSEYLHYWLIKKRIAVDKEAYVAYYCHKEHEAYLDKLSKKNNVSLDECEEKGIPIYGMLSYIYESIEDYIIKKEMLYKVRICIEKLTEQERMLVYELFFKGKSECKIATQLGITQQAIHKRKAKILDKLKRLMLI